MTKFLFKKEFSMNRYDYFKFRDFPYFFHFSKFSIDSFEFSKEFLEFFKFLLIFWNSLANFLDDFFNFLDIF